MSRALPIIAVAASLALAGCVTLFPKDKPSQLYRFGGVSAAAPAASRAAPFNVLRSPTAFSRAAAGDGILTVTGEQVAYVAGGRWVSPATVLFDEAEAHAFEAAGGPGRLITRGSIAKADVILRLDVEAFEARYDSGAQAAPTVFVQVRAVLMRAKDRQVLGDKLFASRKPASDNRLGAIVPAYDAATGDVLGQIVSWTNGLGGPETAEAS